MSQVIENKELEQPAPLLKSASINIALGYFFLVLAPTFLKVTGLTAVGAWPWRKVLFTIWGPWALVAVMSVIGWVVHLVQTRRG